MSQNMGNRFLHAVHHADGQNVIQKLRVKVRRACRCAGDDLPRLRVQPQLHGDLPRRPAILHQRSVKHGQELRRHSAVDKAHLLSIAHGGAAGLGVDDDLHRLVEIGIFVHIHMADAGAGLDAGYGSPLHAGPDQPRAAPRDQQIHQTVGRHEDVGAFVAGVL